jgi:hypothetical protein
MASTAISAQGSTLQVGNGTGSAKTITGVAVGSPTILTITAHGFANGDVVALAALTGADAALLNGQNVVVQNKTTNTIMVEIDTTGKTITAGSGTATPVQWTTVNNWKTWSGFDGQASVIDVTNLSSTAKEFVLGIVDPGTIQLELDQDNSDSGQTVLLTAYSGSLRKQFKITLPNANTATFNAYVRKFTSAGGVDQVVKRQADLQISGAVTWA